MTDSLQLEALSLARQHLAEPVRQPRSPLAPLGAAALAAAGGVGAAWIVILGPSFPDAASADPVRATIASPAAVRVSGAGSL